MAQDYDETYEYDEDHEEDEYDEDHPDEDENEDEETPEYTGFMAILHDEQMEPHVHLGILLAVTFVVAIIVKIIGL